MSATGVSRQFGVEPLNLSISRKPVSSGLAFLPI
jgi:hypothetical protein